MVDPPEPSHYAATTNLLEIRLVLNLASSNLALILFCLVPGFIIMYVRSQFLSGRTPSQSEMLLPNLTVSFIYIALVYPFAGFILQRSQHTGIDVLIWFALIFGVPVVFGLLFGWTSKWMLDKPGNWLRTVRHRIGLVTIHPMKTAWDWKFINMSEQRVIITLKDGTYFGGYCDHNSFMSSEPSERDIYIHYIYGIDNHGKWCLRPGTSMLISAGEVSRIEFLPELPEEGDQ